MFENIKYKKLCDERKVIPAKIKNGIFDIDLISWEYFYPLIETMQDMSSAIFRGVCNPKFNLMPAMYFKKYDRKKLTKTKLKSQYTFFINAIRGRRGPYPTPLSINELWALGRHYGLDTPLIDWTNVPFVALFFAFEKQCKPEEIDNDNRTVFCLKKNQIESSKNNADIIHFTNKNEMDIDTYIRFIKMNNNSKKIAFYSSTAHENMRLINQGGLFTISPGGISVENWVKMNFNDPNKFIKFREDGKKGKTDSSWLLMRIKIPCKYKNRVDDRKNCLTMLNRMNINHSTLFPDMEGAAKYSNMKMEISYY